MFLEALEARTRMLRSIPSRGPSARAESSARIQRRAFDEPTVVVPAESRFVQRSSDADPATHRFAAVSVCPPAGIAPRLCRGTTTSTVQRKPFVRANGDVRQSPESAGAAGGESGDEPQLVVQRTAEQNLDLLKSVIFRNPDPSYATEGSKGSNIKAVAEDHFVTGETGTWHHIYPRNLLKRNLANISRYFVATNGHDSEITETGASHAAMKLAGSSISMDSAGVLTRPAHYYWKDGNGFLGIRSDRRADDPGSLVEHEKPPSMGSGRYELPRSWGREIERLSDTLGDLISLTSVDDLAYTDSKIAKEAENVARAGAQLDMLWPYRTVDIEGKDWARRDTAQPWGARAKNYVMVK